MWLIIGASAAGSNVASNRREAAGEEVFAMWREWATLAAVPIGLALAVFVAPLLRRTLGSLLGAGVVGMAAGALVLVVSGVPFAALVAGAMAFSFALIGSGRAERWVSRASGSAPQGVKGGAGGRGGASGSW